MAGKEDEVIVAVLVQLYGGLSRACNQGVKWRRIRCCSHREAKLRVSKREQDTPGYLITLISSFYNFLARFFKKTCTIFSKEKETGHRQSQYQIMTYFTPSSLTQTRSLQFSAISCQPRADIVSVFCFPNDSIGGRVANFIKFLSNQSNIFLQISLKLLRVQFGSRVQLAIMNEIGYFKQSKICQNTCHTMP